LERHGQAASSVPKCDAFTGEALYSVDRGRAVRGTGFKFWHAKVDFFHDGAPL